MKSFLALLIVLAVTALLISCPEPLTEDVVMAAEDEIAPSISVISPSGNDPYYSEVDFNLAISDDAKTEGDGKGDIASIEFSISNDDFRGGKIEISDGSVTQDDSAGSDEISYDSSSGICSFTFSTVDPNPLSGYISVSITATDRNGNITEETVSLSESTGPWVEFTLLDEDDNENKYIAGEDISLSGTLGNSEDEMDSDDEIESISFTLADTYQGELVLDKDASYEDPYNGNALTSYYDESENLYRRYVYTSVGAEGQYASEFIYDPSTRTFRVDSIEMFVSFSGVVLFNLVATDLNGHETESNVYVSENTQGPIIAPTKVDDAGYYSHFSTAADNADSVTGNVSDDEPLSYFRYSLEYDGSETSVYTYTSNGVDGITIVDGDFTIDYYDKLAAFTTLESAGSGEEVKILIEAAYDSERTSSVQVKMVQDNTAPTITGFSFEGDQGGGEYANQDSTVSYSFTLSDNMDLDSRDTDPNELARTVTINGTAIETDTPVTTGAMSIDYVGAEWSDYAASDAEISYTITVEDRLGNSRSYDNDDFTSPEVMYYDGDEDYSTFLTLNELSADDDGTDNDEDDWARQNEEVLLEVTSSRDIEMISNVELLVDGANSENASSSVGSGDFNYSAAHTGSLTEGDITMSYTIEDMAGNSYDVSVDGISLDAELPVLTGLSYTITSDNSGVTEYGGDWYLNEDMSNVQIVIDGLDAATQDTNLQGLVYRVFSASMSDVQELDGDSDLEVPLDDNGDLATEEDGMTTAYVRLVDIAGNESASDFPVEFYIDTTAPTLSLIEFETDNDTNSAYARNGDNVWVTFEASDANGMDSDGYTVAIHAVDNFITSYSVPAANQRTYSYGLSSEEDDTEVYFSIEVKDVIGNTSTLSTADTDPLYSGPTVNYYSRALDESFISLGFSADHDDGAGNYYAASGETFYLTLATTRDLEAISGTFNGSSVSNIALDAGDNCSFPDSRSDSAEEEISFDFSADDLKDKAGNTWSVNTHPDGDKLHYDSISPVFTGVSFNLTGSNNDVKEYGSDWYINSNLSAGIMIQLTGLDTSGIDEYLKGVQYKVFNGSMSSDIETGGAASYELTLDDDGSLSGKTEGPYSGSVRLVDWAGNTSSSDLSVPFTIDKTYPTLNYVDFSSSYTNSQYAKVGDTVYVTFQSDDDLLMDSGGYSVTINGGATIYDSAPDTNQLKYRRVMSAEEDDKDLPFSVTVEDAAGNTSSISTEDTGYSGNTIRYYSKALSTAVSFSFSAPNNYGSDYFAAKNDNFSLTVSSDRDLETVNGTFNGEVIGPTTFNEGDMEIYSDSNNADDTQSEITFTFTATNKLIDMAGNEYDVSGHPTDHLYYDSLAPSLSSVSSDYPSTTWMQFTFSEKLAFSSAASSAFTLSPSVGGSATGTSPTEIITITGTYTDDQSYTLGFSGVTDRAGNSMVQSTYTIVNDSTSPSSSGIGNQSLTTFSTFDDDSGSSGSDSSDSSGSYKTRSGQMTAGLRTMEELEEYGILASELKSEIQEEMRTKKTQTMSAGSSTVKTVSARIVNRPDLDMGMEALSRAMEQVEKNKAAYQAMLDNLAPVELSTAEMLAMNTALEPEVYEPLTMTVSVSPLVSGSVGEIEVSLSSGSDDITDEKTGSYIALKALIALMGVMATAGFLYLMRRLQK